MGEVELLFELAPLSLKGLNRVSCARLAKARQARGKRDGKEK